VPLGLPFPFYRVKDKSSPSLSLSSARRSRFLDRADPRTVRITSFLVQRRKEASCFFFFFFLFFLVLPLGGFGGWRPLFPGISRRVIVPSPRDCKQRLWILFPLNGRKIEDAPPFPFPGIRRSSPAGFPLFFPKKEEIDENDLDDEWSFPLLPLRGENGLGPLFSCAGRTRRPPPPYFSQKRERAAKSLDPLLPPLPSERR